MAIQAKTASVGASRMALDLGLLLVKAVMAGVLIGLTFSAAIVLLAE